MVKKFWCRVPSCTLVAECHHGTHIRFETLRQWCVKFPHRIFYQFWVAHSQKLRIGLFDRRAIKWGAFDHRATKTWIRSFRGATMSQTFEILTWRDFGPLGQCSRKFPSRIFYPFLAPHTRKLRNGFFDHRATKWCF